MFQAEVKFYRWKRLSWKITTKNEVTRGKKRKKRISYLPRWNGGMKK